MLGYFGHSKLVIDRVAKVDEIVASLRNGAE
jgi:hypothetical protein